MAIEEKLTMTGNRNFSTNLPFIDGKNWDRYVKQMKVIFVLQEVLEVVNNGLEAFLENPIDAQRNLH